MKFTVLPEELKVDHSTPLQIYDYNISNNFPRNKISLSKNTISFLIHGTKEIFGDSESALIDSNQFLVMKSGKCLMTEQVSNLNNTYKSILFFFSDEMVLDFLERNNINRTPLKDVESFYVFEYDKYIKHFVSSLEQLLKFNKRLRSSLLNAKFEEIMIYLLQKEGEEFLISLLQSNSNVTIRLMNVVERNRLKKLTLQELSFLCNMSISTFKREFYKQYQVTPIKWFQSNRLEHAAYLLGSQKKRPMEIYEEAGYENFSNFVQAFKKKFGATPKQYQMTYK